MLKLGYCYKRFKGSFRFIVSLILLPLLLSCATTYPKHPLSGQILKPRPGHDGRLTNQACKEYDLSGSCKQWDLSEYDISDPVFQAQATNLNITCSIGGKRYKICRSEKDSLGKPMNGFCRISFEEDCFLFFCSKPKRSVDYFPIIPYQAVLDSGVECYNEDIYGGEK